MSLEGELVVQLEWDGQRVNEVHIRSTRPQIASRLLVGRSADDARNIVPSLYSVCARAHAVAADVALDAALARPSVATNVETATLAVALEAVGEHMKSLLFDWPRALGRQPNASAVVRARRHVQAMQPDVAVADACALESIAAEFIYGMRPSRWAALATVDALHGWLDDASVEPALILAAILREHALLGASDVLPMPAVDPITLRDPLSALLASAADFERYPTWSGAPMETGALARQQSQALVRAVVAAFGNGVVARIVARLVELALLLQDLTQKATVRWPAIEICTDASGAGVAAVQTARGTLLHRACVRNDRVSEYRIVAPTEWNFHPDGALAKGLRGCRACDEDDLRSRATVAVHALDPCVATRIEVGHA